MNMKNKMVQYGVWPNCCNNCDFCLRLNRVPYTKDQQIMWLKNISNNIDHIDWQNEYSYGISLLGGELYYVTDLDIQNEFLKLIDKIIQKILKPSKNKYCKYSTVTNGLYDPKFLYKVVDKIVEATSIERVDLNFSFDFKYRFKSIDDQKLVLHNINEFHDKYNYVVGVQMILTQYLIDMWRHKEFNINQFIDQYIPGNNLCFLYPHVIHTGKKLDDFNFKRHDFLDFLHYMKNENYIVYMSFMNSTKNSAVFKYTGYKTRLLNKIDTNYSQQPVLSDGKELINEKCGHSLLYRCYADCDKCMMCDLVNIDGDIF